MRVTNVFNAKNQDTSHDTALTSDVMNVMNMDIMSWTALIKYSLLEHLCHTTRHIEISKPDQALDTAEKIKKEETGPDHSLDIVGIAAPTIMTSTEAAADHNNGTDIAAVGAAQGNTIQHTEATFTEPTVAHHTGHTADHPHTTAHQVTALRTTVGHIDTHSTDCQNVIHTREDHAVPDYTPTREPENHTLIGKERFI